MATATAPATITHEPVVGMPRKRVEVAEISGHGHTKDGRRCWTCESSRNPGEHYIVVEATDGSHLWCSCPAGRYGRECRHKTAVSIRIAKEAQEARIEEARHYAEIHAGQLAEDEYYCLPTDKPAPVAARPAHETAILARSNAPFSIWK